MNRREFIKILSASAMVPVIGLPAVGISVEQAMELAKLTLKELPIHKYVYFGFCDGGITLWPRYYGVSVYRVSKAVWNDIFPDMDSIVAGHDWSDFPRPSLDGPYRTPGGLPDCRVRNEKAP